MPTPEASIPNALFAHIATLVLSPVHPIAWPNVSFAPPANRRYLRVSHMPNSTDRLLIKGSGPHRHQGILQVLVCGALNSGESSVRETASLVANHFPADARFAFADVTVRITKRPNIAAALITDTEIQIPVSISYESLA